MRVDLSSLVKKGAKSGVKKHYDNLHSYGMIILVTNEGVYELLFHSIAITLSLIIEEFLPSEEGFKAEAYLSL